MHIIKDLIIQLIIQANENLRATDSKNQQLYYFFIVLSGFYITYSMDKNSSLASVGFNLFLIVLGTVLIFVMIRYQEWHYIYANDSRVLQRLMCLYYEKKDIKLDRELLNSILFDVTKKNKSDNIINEKGITKVYSLISKKGAEYFFFNSFIIINCTILILFFGETFRCYNISYDKPDFYVLFLKWTNLHPYISNSVFTFCIAFLFVLYLYIFNYLKNKIHQETEDKYLDISWILSGFR